MAIFGSRGQKEFRKLLIETAVHHHRTQRSRYGSGYLKGQSNEISIADLT